MTVTFYWDENTLIYNFSEGWTWSEFASARDLSNTLIEIYRKDENYINVHIDYNNLKEWFPKSDPEKGLHDKDYDYVATVNMFTVSCYNDKMKNVFHRMFKPCFEWNTMTTAKEKLSA